ncbi:MAG: hypothetical protein ACYDBB_23535, partial [Armatimonadota bacterium]
MLVRFWRRPALFAALIAALIVVVIAQAYAAVGTISIVSVNPTTINPSQRQTVTVTYSVPVTANVQLYVRNSAGTNICNLASYGGLIGTRSVTWNGKDRTGRIVPNGTYRITIDGQTNTGGVLTSGVANVTVSTGSSTAPTTGAFKVTGITPNPFDPSKGQATIAYSVPTTANYRMYVRNSAGTEVRGLVTRS